MREKATGDRVRGTGTRGGKEEKPGAVFRECVKHICQRDAHRVDYTREWERVILLVLIIEKDDVDDKTIPRTFLWGLTAAPEEKKKAERRKVMREGYKRKENRHLRTRCGIKFTGDTLLTLT